MNLNALTPAATKENTELLRALLSNAVLMREALERIDKRVDKLCCEVNNVCKDIAAANLFD